MKYFLILLISFLFIASCKKEETTPGIEFQKDGELPPATQEGKNTFGMLVNNELWLPKAGCIFCIRLNAGYARGEFNITASRDLRDNGVFQSLNITIPKHKVKATGEYILGNWFDGGAIFFSDNPYTEYRTDFQYTGKLNITRLDTIKGIYSGTFDITLHNDSAGTINITQGRFDLDL